MPTKLKTRLESLILIKRFLSYGVTELNDNNINVINVINDIIVTFENTGTVLAPARDAHRNDKHPDPPELIEYDLTTPESCACLQRLRGDELESILTMCEFYHSQRNEPFYINEKIGWIRYPITKYLFKKDDHKTYHRFLIRKRRFKWAT